MKYCEIAGASRNCPGCLWGYVGQAWPQCPDATDADEAVDVLDEVATKARALHFVLRTADGTRAKTKEG